MSATVMNVRIKLTGELKEKFHKLKEKYGLKSNTELIRILITEGYNNCFKKNETL